MLPILEVNWVYMSSVTKELLICISDNYENRLLIIIQYYCYALIQLSLIIALDISDIHY
jgi:hypothetical protein